MQNRPAQWSRQAIMAAMAETVRRSTAFRTADALASGTSPGRLRTATEAGRIVRLRRGVYADHDDEFERIAAAVLAVDDAVVSHQTAAAIWGIPLLSGAPATIHLTRPRRHTGRKRYPGITVHHATVPPQHRAAHRGLAVTSPARTVVDLARAGPVRAGVSAADGALRLRRCTREDLLAVVADCAGWPGVRRARQVARFADRRAANPLESISRVAFAQYGLPVPLLQAEAPSLDIVDFLWDDYRVVGEADGMGKYVDVEVLRREKLRQERLEQDGFAVVRWTWPEAYHRPDAIAHRAAQTLRRRGWRP